MNNHPFHLVNNSPWPITGSIGVMTLTSGMIMWFHKINMNLFLLGFLIIILTMIQWWRDVVRESTFQGLHTKKVVVSMKLGMILFIISEVLFFSSFFWAFFHSSLAPTMEIGLNWPPMGIKTFDPMNIPMLNTMILLSSGITMTWAHNAIINKNYTQMVQSTMLTIYLGVYFSILQLYEYIESPFCISDSIYGSTFFMSTGFHGIHVMIGTIFIMVSLLRMMNLHFSSNHHVGFEASAWYWHFVDVVWLFLYITVYWWGK
uniref:cytochrome c oxidase subunit III n=1 Tax=Atkinsoniella tiani TaxID=2930059 RepID=UPI002001B089|nr:cytochrome c oxidase subunit III [Atkinsoniella tiani]YP_010363543.1 cytochrome c oxidase subunit III [Atkinsoniella warpa]UNZ12618.1 cytochrome c oxidase subunit III [Atkinsoniella tiani]UNZ12644.1 cytochrome c oxidase subunit III [Atkinsoniella warpa]